MESSSIDKTIAMPARTGLSGTLISAKTYFSDRFTPSTEHIYLPEFLTPSGKIKISLIKHGSVCVSTDSLKDKVTKLFLRQKNLYLGQDEVVVDFTKNSPENWAHTLDFYIPLFLFLRNELAAFDEGKRLLALLPQNIPRYITRIFEVFRLEYIVAPLNVSGTMLHVDMSSFDCIRSFARQWLEKYLLHEDHFVESISMIKPTHGRKNLFISRRGTRYIKNEKEIEKLLCSRGFYKVYAEDMSPEDQIRSFVHCEAIVAIHGAAIAPLLYRGESSTKLKLVEVFHPGHMTNFYRGMAGQSNCKWVGVRGEIEPRWVKPSYQFDKKFTKYSLTGFRVDPESLIESLEVFN